MITVAELIEMLKTMPGNMQVCVPGLDEGMNTVNKVRTTMVKRTPADKDYYGDYLEAESYVGENCGEGETFEVVLIRG